MMKPTNLIAVCGIDCESCDIRKAPEDPEAAKRIVAWFKKEGWLNGDEGIKEVMEKSMYCTGCRGDPLIHWTPDCWILKCCVHEKGHEFCYQCNTFPCKNLVIWAEQNDHYSEALNRLKDMKEKQKS
jgi:hypothetical protein